MRTAIIVQPVDLPDIYFDYMVERTRFHLTEAEKMWANFDKNTENLYSSGIPADIKLDIICNVVCNYFGTNMEYVKETKHTRFRDLVIVRQMIFYFCTEYLTQTITRQKISKLLEFNHATIHHHHQLVKSYLYAGYSDYKNIVDSINKILKKNFEPTEKIN